MVHLVKVNDEVFAVPGRLIREVLARYATGSEVNYNEINNLLTNNRIAGGDAPEHFSQMYVGHLDFDAMKEQQLRTPVRIGNYLFGI